MMKSFVFNNFIHHDEQNYFPQNNASIKPNKYITNILFAVNELLKIRNHTVFYDIGANCGVFGWLCKHHSCDYYAWEPNTQLNQYILKNSMPKQIINHAISDHVGKIGFEINQLSQSSHCDDHSSHQIECATIDSYDFDKPDIIKIDVEGHEYPALKGAEQTMINHKPWLVIEDKWHNQSIHDFMINLGYQCHTKWRIDSIWHHLDNPIDHAPWQPPDSLQIFNQPVSEWRLKN